MAAEIATIFGGTWKVDRSENFEAFLEAAGIGFTMRKVATNIKPTMEIKVNGDDIEVSLLAGVRSKCSKFQLNKEFESDTEYPAMATATLEGNKLIINSKAKDSKRPNQKVTREIINGELVQTMELGTVVAKRIFKKI